MAYKNYGRRAYSGARRYGNRAYGGYKKAASYGRKYQQSNPVKVRASQEFIAGLAIGFTNMDDKIPSEAKLLGATMPVSGSLGGKVKGVSQGIVFGNMLQHMLNFRTGEDNTSTSGEGI